MYESVVEIADIAQCNFSEISQSGIDDIYNMLVGFQNLTSEAKQAFAGAIIDVTKRALAIIGTTNSSDVSNDCKDSIRIVLYFFQQLCFRAEAWWATEPKDGADKPLKSAKPKKGTRSKRTASYDEDEDINGDGKSFNWAPLRRFCIDICLEMAAMDPNYLWKMGIVADAYATNLWKYPLSLLELAASSTSATGFDGVSGNGSAEAALRNTCISLHRLHKSTKLHAISFAGR